MLRDSQIWHTVPEFPMVFHLYKFSCVEAAFYTFVRRSLVLSLYALRTLIYE